MTESEKPARSCPMPPIIGDRIKSRLTGQVYEVEMIKATAILLRSEDRLTRVWIDPKDLMDLYESM